MTIFFLILLLIASPAWGFNRAFLAATTVGQCDDKTGMLWWEDMEGDEYDQSPTESCAGGTCDGNDTTAPIIEGAQQLKMAYTDGNISVTKTFTAQGSLWVHFGFKLSDATPATAPIFLRLRASTTDIFAFRVGTGGRFYAWHGAQTSGDFGPNPAQNNTVYHLWIEFVKGASGGVGNVYYGTTRVFASATKFTFDWGDGNSDIDNIYFYLSTNATDLYIDNVRVKATSIGDVCE